MRSSDFLTFPGSLQATFAINTCVFKQKYRYIHTGCYNLIQQIVPADLPSHAQEKGYEKRRWLQISYRSHPSVTDYITQHSQGTATHSAGKEKVIAWCFSRDSYSRNHTPALSVWYSGKQHNPTFKVLLWIPGNRSPKERVRGMLCIVLKAYTGYRSYAKQIHYSKGFRHWKRLI